MEEIITNIKEIISKYSNISSFAQVGSSIEDELYNDLDFIFVVKNRFEGLNFLINSFSKYNIEINDDALKIKEYCNVDISIAVYSYSEMDSIVSNFIKGEKVVCEHRFWTLGYWIGEGFIADLKKCKIVYDSENRLKQIKEKLNTKLFYSEKKILKDCKKELELKNSKLHKNMENNLTDSLLKNDIILSMIRSSYILSNRRLKGFKKISQTIESLPQEYKNRINNYINNEDEKCIVELIDEINSIIRRKNDLYLGTWQFDGTFNDMTDEEIIDLIKYAKKRGINKFDTALVYGNGKVEKLLSKVINDNDIVITKIPAKIKPSKDKTEKLETYYDENYINNCVKKSLSNLDRTRINIVLLHNWSKSWDNSPVLLDWLLALKENNIIDKIGISLPNGYNERLPQQIISKIDVIEVPYNIENQWILNDIEIYKENNIEIILRSLFMQGKLLEDNKEKYKEILNIANLLETSIVIGMTKKEQIDNNIKIIEKDK